MYFLCCVGGCNLLRGIDGLRPLEDAIAGLTVILYVESTGNVLCANVLMTDDY